MTALPDSLRAHALQTLLEADLTRKLALTHQIPALLATLPVAPDAVLTEPPGLPGRPAAPPLVAPDAVPRRSAHTRAGRAALIHAICHIEFNAINLALDAVWRFPGLPEDYYRDWLRVAAEEARHFDLLHALLQGSLGHRYGDFPAHDGLWTMCERTRDDPVARMALVPRTLEARGLDANPLIQQRLRAVDTPDAPDVRMACDILDIILREEIGHVAIGNHWYRWLCAEHGLDPIAHEAELIARYRAPRARPPINAPARRAAGFTEAELAALMTGQETTPAH